MTAEELIWELQYCDYKLNGNDFTGFDCFGLVEFWHSQLHDIEILDRKRLTSDPNGFSEGFGARSVWQEIDNKQDHCVAVMKSRWGGRTIQQGHCGIYYKDKIYHFESDHGFRCDDLNKRTESRITGWFKHKRLLS